MQTLTRTTLLSFIVLLIVSLNACKKSDDNKPDGKGSGSYTYMGNTTNTTRGDYLQADGNTYIYVYGQQPADIVQIIFNQLPAITPGNYTYQAAGNGYDPAKNFSGGSVTTAAQPGGDNIIGGTVNVSNDGEGFLVEFECVTASGTVKGTYTGKFTSR